MTASRRVPDTTRLTEYNPPFRSMQWSVRMMPAADMHIKGGSKSQNARFRMYALCSFPDLESQAPSEAQGLAHLLAKAGVAELLSESDP
jgi:hypothetical protein